MTGRSPDREIEHQCLSGAFGHLSANMRRSTASAFAEKAMGTLEAATGPGSTAELIKLVPSSSMWCHELQLLQPSTKHVSRTILYVVVHQQAVAGVEPKASSEGLGDTRDMGYVQRKLHAAAALAYACMRARRFVGACVSQSVHCPTD